MLKVVTTTTTTSEFQLKFDQIAKNSFKKTNFKTSHEMAILCMPQCVNMSESNVNAFLKNTPLLKDRS